MTTEKHVKDKLKAALKPYAPYFWHFMPVSLGMGTHGIPDFVCCYHGIFVAIETKRPGRQGEANCGLSALQVKVREQIIKAGGKYFVVDDAESIEDVVFWLKTIAEAMVEASDANHV